MRFVNAEEVHRALDFPGLVEALRGLFAAGVDGLERYSLSQPTDAQPNDWILLPAWQFGKHMGIKLVSVFPQNEKQGLPSVQGLYLLFDGQNGLPIAAIDGTALTLRKTAANSALASTYLSRQDSSFLLMVGAGALSANIIAAHCAVRPIERVVIWNRTAARAEAIAKQVKDELGIEVSATTNLEEPARQADIISCATMSTEPLIKGAWLKEGAHLDLIGGYRPEMREADNEAILRGRVFVDTRMTTLPEAGDVLVPIKEGILKEEDITDTFQLARGELPGRLNDKEITVFKSGGGGHEDLGTAQYLLSKLSPS